MKKFWGEIYSQNRQLFESFYRFEFTFMYHEKMDFFCASQPAQLTVWLLSNLHVIRQLKYRLKMKIQTERFENQAINNAK